MTDFLRGVEHRHGTTAEIDSAKHPNQWFYDTTLTRMGLYESDGTTIHYVLTTDSSFKVNESIVHFQNIPGGDLGADFQLVLESNDTSEIKFVADSDGGGGGGGPHALRMLLNRDGEFKLLESPSGNVCMLLDITTCRLGVGKGIVLPDATLQLAELSGTTAILTLETLGLTNDCIFNIENATQQWQFNLDGNSSFTNAHALVLRDITGGLNDVMVWERVTGRVGINQNNPRILFDVNGEASAQIISKGHLNLLGLVFNTTSTVDIAVGNCRNSTDVFNINVTGTLTADITVVGAANGLDSGAEAADTWYAVFVIGDTTGANSPASLLSLSATSPTLPGTHNIFRRVGWVRNNSSSNFIEFRQVWNGLTRRYWWDETEVNLRILNEGTATVFTALNANILAPSTSNNLLLSVQFRTIVSGGNASDGLTIKSTDDTNDGAKIFMIGVKSNSFAGWTSEINCSSTQQISYKVDDAVNQASIFINGFDDEL